MHCETHNATFPIELLMIQLMTVSFPQIHVFVMTNTMFYMPIQKLRQETDQLFYSLK